MTTSKHTQKLFTGKLVSIGLALTIASLVLGLVWKNGFLYAGWCNRCTSFRSKWVGQDPSAVIVAFGQPDRTIPVSCDKRGLRRDQWVYGNPPRMLFVMDNPNHRVEGADTYDHPHIWGYVEYWSSRLEDHRLQRIEL